MVGRSLWCVVVLGVLAAGNLLTAQEFRDRPYDSLQAGQDAYRRAEELRRNNIAVQAETNDYLRQRATWRPVYGEDTIYFRSPYGNSYDYPPSYGGYGYSYQSSRRGFFGNDYSQGQIVITPSYSGGEYYPRDPYRGLYRQGYIAGYVRDNTIPYIRQPIGQRQIQTGPNRWESHPVYAEDPPALRVTPPVADADEDTPRVTPGPIVRPKIITPREY